MPREPEKRIVVVAGDITIDWNIARIRRGDATTQAWNAEDVTRASCQPGGAAMLVDLLEAAAADMKQGGGAEFDIRRAAIPRGKVSPYDKRFVHSYAIWTPFRLDERQPGNSRAVWRVQEFLGLYRADDSAVAGHGKSIVDDPASPDLIVIDDANLGFRDHEDLWPKALKKRVSDAWILVKMARPVARGKLWDHLCRHYAGRLVVVLPASDLRFSQVHISSQLSWERTAQDSVWELLYNPQVKQLSKCAHVLVSFGTAGVIALSGKSKSKPEAVLFFDPNAMEGEWGLNHGGHMIGYNTCLTAGVARELMQYPSNLDLARGIQSGIHAARTLHMQGYGDVVSDLQQMDLVFPASTVAGALAQDVTPLAMARVRNPAQGLAGSAVPGTPATPVGSWTILGDQKPDSLEEVAYQIVIEGLERVLPGIPIEHFRQLTTVDRNEIEALHSISSIVREYCARRKGEPLSIAVFGQPGSGKSFAVKEVVNSILPGRIEPLSFNLSQFSAPDDLLDAFHQVRDKALSGSIPLVFWDEFDTTLHGQELGWLRYFLVPMQDGQFVDGQIAHPIGQSIFVFAGGTSHSMESFAISGQKARRDAKVPDFISRLKGFLNIIGPNRQTGREMRGDPFYVVRRAVVLRTIIQRKAPQLIRNDGGRKVVCIDPGLLHAFLRTKKYVHGIRSMEAIVLMSQLAGRTSFERSSLPSETQLNLHVDGPEFLSLMHRAELDQGHIGQSGRRGYARYCAHSGDGLIEELAEAAHEVFCQSLKAQGYRYGRVTREGMRTHSSLVPWSMLQEDEKEQNRGYVRDIVKKLASIEYTVRAARSGEHARGLSKTEIEKLARLEHMRWMQAKQAAGWKHARRTDKIRKLHRCLVPWAKLPQREQDKDRVLVQAIPKILAKAGYVMVSGT